MKKEEPYTNVMKKYEKVYKQAKKAVKSYTKKLIGAEQWLQNCGKAFQSLQPEVNPV